MSGKNRDRNFPDCNRTHAQYFAYLDITSALLDMRVKRINKFVSDRRHWFATKYVFLGGWLLLITQAISMNWRSDGGEINGQEPRASVDPPDGATRWEESRRTAPPLSMSPRCTSLFICHTQPAASNTSSAQILSVSLLFPAL